MINDTEVGEENETDLYSDLECDIKEASMDVTTSQVSLSANEVSNTVTKTKKTEVDYTLDNQNRIICNVCGKIYKAKDSFKLHRRM